MIQYCAYCGAPLDSSMSFCARCGKEVRSERAKTNERMTQNRKFFEFEEVEEWTCEYCGTQNHASDLNCRSCCAPRPASFQKRKAVEVSMPEPEPIAPDFNQNIQAEPTNRRVKNKWVAFFLCLFLGFVGAHKFYEERIGLGIVYIFTGGLFGVGYFIDLICLLCKPNYYTV